jgi:hypothetical protein
MKKILAIPAFLFMGLISCNSGNSSESAANGDSTSMSADTSMHMNMDMTSESNMPAAPEGSSVSFKNLKDGETVSSPLKVEMEATGISVDSAGVVKPNSGHFHILIDVADSIATGVVIPTDSAHLHFGHAQKEATLKLSPGKHQLTLQFADGAHRSYGSKLASAISVNVK